MFYKYKKIVLSLLLLVSEILSADGVSSSLTERVLGAIGQSSFMHAYSKNVQTKIDLMINHKVWNIGEQPADLRYQELWKQVQMAVEIPLERQLPLRKLNQEQAAAMSYSSAIAESDAMYIDEEFFNKSDYGSVRSCLFHEAIHVKHHDKSVNALVRMAAWAGAWLGVSTTLKPLQIRWHKSLSLVLTIGLVATIMTKHTRFLERRADTQGHYATGCAICVREVARNIASLPEDCFDDGYLRPAELEKIAQDLGNKKCQYHADNQSL